MGKTLQDLQKENKRLLNEAESRRELVKIGEERLRLQQQNQRLLKQLRRSPSSVAVRNTLGSVGRGFFKAGKSVGSGLMRYGRFLNEQEIKNQKRVRRVKKVSKTKTKFRRR